MVECALRSAEHDPQHFWRILEKNRIETAAACPVHVLGRLFGNDFPSIFPAGVVAFINGAHAVRARRMRQRESSSRKGPKGSCKPAARNSRGSHERKESRSSSRC